MHCHIEHDDGRETVDVGNNYTYVSITHDTLTLKTKEGPWHVSKIIALERVRQIRFAKTL